MDVRKLKVEIDTDPLTRGYSGMTDLQVADNMNVVDRSEARSTMSGIEVSSHITDTDYDGLTDAKKSQILALTAHSSVDPFGFAANVVKNIFGTGSDTLIALAAARSKTVSRGVELGLGIVRAGHVQDARRIN